MTTMTLAEQAIVGREFKTVVLPDGFNVYCVKCNTIMRSGTLTKRYDGATYAHETCPNLPLKNVAVHKY